MKTKTTSDHALEYVLTKGYSVLPVGADKRPLVGWKDYQKRLPLENELVTWWGKNKDAGLGIVTGRVSGITVVDIDVKEKGHMTPKDFPATYTVRTPSGGWHLYYEYDPGVGTVARGWEALVGVDIRNDGGYVVAPPSNGYEVVEDNGGVLATFPAEIFKTKGAGGSAGKKTGSFKLSEGVGVSEGGRNDKIARVIGGLLRSMPSSLWSTEVWETVVAINQTYQPPLGPEELRTTFESIASREKAGRVEGVERVDKETIGVAKGDVPTNEGVLSPVVVSDVEAIKIRLRGNKGGPYKDVTNAVFALGSHSEWKDAFRYDLFRKEILFNGEPMEDTDVVRAQIWLQRDIDLNGISKTVVQDAVEERAKSCEFNSALDWLRGLEWDGVARVDSWVPVVYGVENDEYHQKVGSNWLRAMVKRLVMPGSKFDHVLVVQGGQGVRKTTSFAVLGGPFHVETTVHAGSKDFLMQFDGKAIVEFSEGETLNRSETKELKAIITRTHDKYRAPYARRDKEHPRMCVFCMTTNDVEFLKDETGNRRWWIVKMPDEVSANVEWLEENRDQLYAEAFARVKEETWEVPEEEALRWQEDARNVDVLEEEVVEWFTALDNDVKLGGVSIKDFFSSLYANSENGVPKVLDWRTEQKVKGVFKGTLGLKYAQRRVDGERKRMWYPTVRTAKKGFSEAVVYE